MAANDYHFVTRWEIDAPPELVFDILADAERLSAWWPSVYLDVTVTREGDARSGVGRRVELFTKGWLPYTLRWGFDVTESARPTRMALRASGDFEGEGIWTIEPTARGSIATYDWRIRADKPLLRVLSFVMKPIFAANHEWAMARGHDSLRLEIARRRAGSPDERARIPAPPPPTWPHARWHAKRRALAGA